MVDEIEVEVRALDEPPATPPFVDAMRKLLLASIGALALSREQTDAFVKRLVERGELAQKDGEKVLGALSDRLRPEAAQSQFAKAEAQMETGLEQLLNRLNIPSKRDIDDLSAKIAHLAARVEELRQNKA
ncbi:MAG: phasin family protein [Chloroflexales bacterium]|nr:phasin family protein [Chloroflexales bacterium]